MTSLPTRPQTPWQKSPRYATSRCKNTQNVRRHITFVTWCVSCFSWWPSLLSSWIPWGYMDASCHMCQCWVKVHHCSSQSDVTQEGGPENVLPSFLGYELWDFPEEKTHWRTWCPTVIDVFFFSFVFHSGGYSTWQPALSMPSAVFCLDCAVWPTSQCFPVSAGSRSAVQTTVIQQVLWLKLISS